MDQNVFNGTFFITACTLVCGFLSLVVRYMVKSKCSDASICFGVVTIKRDTKSEVEFELKEMEMLGVAGGKPGEKRNLAMDSSMSLNGGTLKSNSFDQQSGYSIDIAEQEAQKEQLVKSTNDEKTNTKDVANQNDQIDINEVKLILPKHLTKKPFEEIV